MESTPKYDYSRLDDPRFPSIPSLPETNLKDEVIAPTHQYSCQFDLGGKIENLVVQSTRFSPEQIRIELLKILDDEGLSTAQISKIAGRTGYAIQMLLDMSKPQNQTN